MPPESLPRDRKDIFGERNNERSLIENLGGSGGGSANRWRDIHKPAGYGKRCGSPMLSQEPFCGSGPSRSNDKILDDESCRPFGKYGRSSRENRGEPLSQRVWKGHSWDAAAVASSRSGAARIQADLNDKRSVDDLLTCKSHPYSDIGNNCNQFHFKDQNDTNAGVRGSCTGQKFEGEKSLGSIDWKTLNWTRSGSLSSRGSGLSHSSSSKSMGADSSETKVDLRPQNVSPLKSPSGGAGACSAADATGAGACSAAATTTGAGASFAAACFAAATEETSSRKKPRLGWGEGLAKFEKKKSPCDTASKNGLVVSESNREHVTSHGSSVPDGSPRVAGHLGSTSPATPSSVACSSSPVVGDKSVGKAVNVETANLCSSPSQESEKQYKDLSSNIVTLEEIPIANLCSSLGELLQHNDPSSLDSGFVRSTVMNKLLVLKADVSKQLEATESEIDSLENVLKSLVSDTGSVHPYPASSSSLPVLCFSKPSEEIGTASKSIPRPVTLQTSEDTMKEKFIGSPEGELAEGKDEHIDSPGTATSKFAETIYMGKAVSQVDMLNRVECSWNANASRHDNEVKSSEYAVNEEATDTIPIENIDSGRHMLSYDAGVQTETIYDLIVASNKESAHRAYEVFSKFLPTNLSCFDISKVDSNSSSPSRKDNPLVKEKFAMRKRFMRFKERVTVLKFRAFKHLWKEDLCLLSIKKSRAKSQKKFELGTRMLHSGYQKHRASIRSRFSYPAGNLSLVPTTQLINFASKLLADSGTKIYRSALNMPSLLLDNKAKIISRFISSNGLVEDPCAAEKERCTINPWTSEERDIFLDKLSIFGKDFRKIACFLNHKTTADCVEFYYKNHKSDCFQKTKKKPEFAKKGKSYSKNTYLVTSGKRWNRDNSTASLDLLGAASAIAANDNDNLKIQNYAPRLLSGYSGNSRTAKVDDGRLKSSALSILGNERENVAADVLAGICGSLSSEAMSSCITSSIGVGEGCQERKCQPFGLSRRRSLTPEVAQDVDEGTCSDESCSEVDPSDWTDEEKSIFVNAVLSYGKDFAMISQCVRTKSMNQCKVFYSKARKCLGLDVIHPGSCGGEAPPSENADGGGGSDTEDTCLVETGSGISGEKSVSRPDDEMSLSSTKANQSEAYPSRVINIEPDSDSLEKISNAGELDVKVKLQPEDAVSAESEKNNMDLVIDGDNNFGNYVGRELLAVKVVENENASPETKSGHNEAVECGSSEKSAFCLEVSNNVKRCNTSADRIVYSDNSLAEGQGPAFPLPGNSFNNEGLKIMPVSAGNASHSASTNSLATDTLPGYKHQSSMKADAAHCFVSQNSVLQDSVVMQNEKSLNLTSKLDSDKTDHTELKNSISTEVGHHQHLCEHSSVDHIDLSRKVQAYPPSVPTEKGMDGDIGCYKPATTQTISKVDMNFRPSQFLPPDSFIQKCNSKDHDVRAELQLLSQDRSKENQRKPRPRCLSDSDKPTRNGDVKLFGQILTHPSTQQMPNCRTDEKEDRNGKHAKLCDNSYNLKPTPSRNVDGVLATTKFNHNNYMGLRNLPVSNFGFWDGNRIQTGLSSLPDSAILLAKYPAAFSNYPTSSSKIEQQQQQQLRMINDCNLIGTAVMPTRQLSSSKGVATYQAYMNGNRANLQPYPVDLKQRQDRFFSELQRRETEFGALSSVQLQARGTVGLNPVNRRGILFGGGGPRNTVSDPVAAIRRHYAQSEHYSGQIGSIIRTEGAWRSNGDVGR